ncbi:MAG: competence/damage-inducible protein A [Acidobacteriota bacterium]|nr:competence/damage-inducible protein A [Acidobacteriota bacterium]
MADGLTKSGGDKPGGDKPSLSAEALRAKAEGLSIDAAIIAVGSELLTPHKVDTNSLFITQVLNDLGIAVAHKAIVGDNRAELAAQVAHGLARHQVLILTGGLGPTDDDLTREVVAGHLGLTMDEDPAIVDAIERRFAARGWKMPAVNRRQALVPRGATVLANPNGTAPGLWIEHDGAAIALLPGPPREMKPMMDGEVRTRLAPFAGLVRLHRRVIRVSGRGESAVEEMVQPIYSGWLNQSPPIETTILAGLGQVELHLLTQATDVDGAAIALDAAVNQITTVMGADVVSVDGRELEAVVGDLLRQRRWHVALAESCTGGLATSRLTDIPGSSDYVERSVVAYSNRSKVELLGVGEALIAEHGAVSEPVAVAMATGIRDRAGAAVGVGITGIAGPGGGSEHKPVGTVCIAVAGRDTRVRTFRFPGGREMVKALSANTAIDMLRRLLLEV